MDFDSQLYIDSLKDAVQGSECKYLLVNSRDYFHLMGFILENVFDNKRIKILINPYINQGMVRVSNHTDPKWQDLSYWSDEVEFNADKINKMSKMSFFW